MTQQADHRGNTKTTHEEWLEASRVMLIEDGIERVKVDRLAKKLDVSRGGFYWFFKNRQDLLFQLLDDWQSAEKDPFTYILKDRNFPAMERLLKYAKAVMSSIGFDPALDMAIRDWARISAEVKEVVEKVDDRRIQALSGLFAEMGENKEEAFIRARIYYFHQIGYYTIGLKETQEQRRAYLPIYFKQLIGREMPEDLFDTL